MRKGCKGREGGEGHKFVRDLSSNEALAFACGVCARR